MAEDVYPNWTQETDPAWSAVTAYVIGDRVLVGGVSYHCILGHTNQSPPNATYWTPRYLVRINHYEKLAKDFADATITTVYEDKGADFNYSAADVPQEWELRYTGKGAQSQLKILLDFWDAHKLVVPFTFVEPRGFPLVWGAEGDTVTGVRFKETPEGLTHQKVNSWSLNIRLIKYPT